MTVKVSIVIPTRNEEKYLPLAIESLLDQNYPQEKMEILIVDAMSDDNTRIIIKEFQEKFHNIKLLNNPKLFTPFAFNIGLKESQGDIIFFLGAHTKYSKNYISTVEKYIDEGKAECVGSIAITLPGSDTSIAKAIAIVLSSPFGVGNSYMRIGIKEIRYVDTASCSGYSKEVFKRIGLFNEGLIYSQDIELNTRLRKAGMRILLAPEIISYYHARSDFISFSRHNFRNGRWAILPFIKSSVVPVSLRHMVPLLFVSTLISTLVLGAFIDFFLYTFLLIIFTYTLCSVFFSIKEISRTNDLKVICLLPLVFASLHIVNGIGSLSGVSKILKKHLNP